MSEKLKILFLGEPSSANTRSWTEGLKELGCEIYMASARSGGSDGALPIGWQALPPRLRILTGARSVRKMIREIKPDLLLAYRVTSYGWLGAKTAFHPLVIAAQNEQITYYKSVSPLKARFLGVCARFALKNADLLHAWSDNIKAGLLKFGAAEEKILTLHRGVDTDVFSPPGDRRFRTDHPKIISTRALHAQYKIDILIRAFAILEKKYSGAALTITGGGPEKENLARLAQELGIADKVIFTGKIAPAEIAGFLKDADIYASMIETEGLSSSLIEACACGTLPAAADIPASQTIIEHERNGVLFPLAAGPEEAAEILRDAYDNVQLRRACAENNPPLIREKYDRRKNLEIFISKYKALAEARR